MDRVPYQEATAVRLNALVSNMDVMSAWLTADRLPRILGERARQACPAPPKGRKKTERANGVRPLNP